MDYLVTKITDINSKKVKVEINYDLKISLYKGEIKKFGLAEGKAIDNVKYIEIMEELLPKRASERCINLLAKRSMTEMELRRKLKEGIYPDSIIDNVIEKLNRYSLINDKQYVSNYFETYSKTKSMRQIKQNLMNKGISREVLESVFEETGIDEEANIRRIIEKKFFSCENASAAEKNKIASYLLRKGYGYDLIRKCVFNDKSFV